MRSEKHEYQQRQQKRGGQHMMGDGAPDPSFFFFTQPSEEFGPVALAK